MERRNFIKKLGASSLLLHFPMKTLNELSLFKEQGQAMPVLFIGHGSPMNAIEVNEFAQGWSKMAKSITKPNAILCVSAHWETNGTRVCAVPNPKTIHDFYGFPKALYDKQYPAPGSPEFARLTADEIKKTHVELDFEWGLDHGSWSILCHMFPLADVPVYQLSLDRTKPPQYHYDLAKELQGLRKKGVLIVGSGNMVHNLRLMRNAIQPFDWAFEFDSRLKKLITDNNHDALIHYEKMGTVANLSIPTNEHYLPLLYTLAQLNKNESVSFFNEKTVMGSVSMTSLIIK